MRGAYIIIPDVGYCFQSTFQMSVVDLNQYTAESFLMQGTGVLHNKPYKKSARIVVKSLKVHPMVTFAVTTPWECSLGLSDIIVDGQVTLVPVDGITQQL